MILNDGRGALESRLRRFTDWVGFDPYDVCLRTLRDHSRAHEGPRASRFAFKSPCWAVRAVDFVVHRLLPAMLLERHPRVAARLAATSPRWGRNHPAGVVPVPIRKEIEKGLYIRVEV